MPAKLTKLLVFATILIYIFSWIFFWLFETTDSYFYWAFADFLKRGIYFAPHPYYWTIPTTFTPPLYSLFLYAAQVIPRSDILIHGVQLLAVLVSGYFIFKVLSGILHPTLSRFVMAVYLLAPVHVFVTSNLMTESFAIAAVSLFTYLSFLVIDRHKKSAAKYLLVVSATSVLIRYNLISFFLLSLFLMVLLELKTVISFQKKRAGIATIVQMISNITFTVFGIGIIVSWIFINHRLNGSWGLSDQAGKNLYNRVVAGDKLTPPARDPNWILLQSIASKRVNLFYPSYDIEPVVIEYFSGNVARESAFLGSVALSAIRAHPVEYARRTLVNMVLIHANGAPYPHGVYTDSYWMGKNCRTLGTISFCVPVIHVPFAKPLWDTLVFLMETYYAKNGGFVNALFLAPALIFSFVQKNTYIRYLAFCYVVGVATVTASEVPVYRYLYPLFPIKTVLIVYVLARLPTHLRIRRTPHPPQARNR